MRVLPGYLLGGVSWLIAGVLSAAPLPREFYGVRLEPREAVLAGAGQDAAGYADYVAALGIEHAPAYYMTYVGVSGAPEAATRWVEGLARELAPYPADTGVQLGLAFTVDGRGTTSQYADAVIRGDHDARLDALGAALAALQRPVWVRIGYEFAGTWNGYEPESYRAAFRHITHRLRAKLGERMATVWCGIGLFDLARHLEFYPGDDVVDWWGLDLFEPAMFAAPGTRDFVEAAHAHRKPLMLGELTPATIGADRGRVSWNGWYRAYFELVERSPGIKAVSYINWQWNATRWGWLDARVSQMDATLSGWVRDRLLQPPYRGATERAPTRVWRLPARGTAGGEPRWKPTGRPWEGRLGAGAGWDLERDVPRWVEFDLALLHGATEAVRAELWLAVWPAADATGIVIVIDGDGREIGRALRGAAGAAAFARADVAAALQAARVRGDATLRLGLLNGGSTAVAVDAPDDPDPFEPQLLVWTSRE